MEDTTAFIPYDWTEYNIEEVSDKAQSFYQLMDRRRTVREFSDKPVPKEVIENIIMTASSAPSGAHKQPWTFAAVSDPGIKKKIRVAAEKEEYDNYHGRMSERWLKDLEPFDTDWNKPFIEIAPWLIVVYRRIFEINEAGEKVKNYYINESVGIATGFLLAAIHNAGLAALTHTPSPMNFLTEVLNRPDNERAFLLIPVGYPADGVQVPDITRKPVEKVIKYF